MKAVLVSAIALAASLPAAAQNKPANPVGELVETASFGLVDTRLDYSNVMFDRQEYVTNKPLQQLLYRADGRLEQDSLYLGGRFIGSGIFEWTNTDGKFPILSRLPTQHNTGDSGTEWVINDASFNATLNAGSWLTGFIQGEYTEVEYPGQDDFQWRKYWVTVGDLSQAPVYASFGRNTVSWGNFTSYAPFTHNHSSHYFWAQSDDPHLEVGYYDDGLQIAASLIPSSRGLRVLNTPDTTGWENFAISSRYAFGIQPGVNAEIGAGYLHSTIYDSTLAHHPPTWNGGDNDRNAAINAHATLTYHSYDLNVEYTQTVDEWPATDHHVSAITTQARWRHSIAGLPTIASIMYSRGVQGDDGTEWERMDQLVLGYEILVLDNLKLGTEYLFNRGFVPLIMPTFTGDRSVETHTVIVGVEATF